MTRCLAPDCRMGGVGCDNMTVIIVCLLQGQDYSELSNKCARLPASEMGMLKSLVRERSTYEALDDDDTDEWFDCADDLLMTSTTNDISSSVSNHKEKSEVVKQEDEERRQEDEVGMEEDVEQIETTTQTLLNNDRQEENMTSQYSNIDSKHFTVDNEEHSLLFSNGDHDNQPINNNQTDSTADRQVFKTTAV